MQSPVTKSAIQLSNQQKAAQGIAHSGSNVFLTGWAGTGKSTVSTQIIGSAFKSIDMLATTGIAALNLAQQYQEKAGLTVRSYTVYRYAGIMLGPKAGQSFEDYWQFLESSMTRTRRAAYHRIRRAECILIDEVSMLPGRILNYLNWHFKRVRDDQRPFGGIQVITVGDFLQLPPVRTDKSPYDWAFRSPVWEELQFANCYLTETFRQRDPDFINALNDFRVGRIRDTTAKILQTRIARFPNRNITRLFTHNRDVTKWNDYQLSILDTEAREFTATVAFGTPDQQAFLIKNMITPQELTLKIGARVMFTANIAGDGDLLAANGECGYVRAYDQQVISYTGEVSSGGVLIQKDDGSELVIGRKSWQFDVQDPESATFTQYPLRLAYAMTIHKSQGLTLDAAVIDIRSAMEPGQAYVALSRLRSLEGLLLKDYPSGVVISPDAIQLYRDLEKSNALKGY